MTPTTQEAAATVHGEAPRWAQFLQQHRAAIGNQADDAVTRRA